MSVYAFAHGFVVRTVHGEHRWNCELCSEHGQAVTLGAAELILTMHVATLHPGA